MGEAPYTEGEWTSADGLTLRYRDYPGRDDRPAILCIPGLTRNARDFEPVADAFAGEWRVVCPDLRGRGQSDYARDPASYTPASYVADIAALFDQAELGRVVAIGTSLGGIVIMLLALQSADRFAGVVLNDIGPEVEEDGLDRIRDYVGQGRSFPTWIHAARALKEQNGDAYPEFELSDWLRLSKRMMCVGGSGRIAFDYDMKIAEPFHAPQGAEPHDMWPAFRALAGRPLLTLRGELSDILSTGTLARMQKEVPDMEAVVIPGKGHAPTLEEPLAQQAIAALLAKCA
ncbi:pimeloyl-ACP methyl ester carboxylesterase [Altererythrobacter atlanticus]|uniref:3-oxoadipate enol-lactonase 2 n=1 Tax=Croceibacterium atlanticum TaxID=1267766 RepID=A0A0F7KRR8_9SPHN|nr:alpha/beta hydrolase [Croceibacterium atlanticum]AKH42299.1 3-oxoadipate enol-lactonase 2 [Croceibacterium atlanticum]MBB5731076.1 pimeloyl-ACP methyl ester carboxylesterase [Croceibacterium atlanticum]